MLIWQKASSVELSVKKNSRAIAFAIALERMIFEIFWCLYLFDPTTLAKDYLSGALRE